MIPKIRTVPDTSIRWNGSIPPRFRLPCALDAVSIEDQQDTSNFREPTVCPWTSVRYDRDIIDFDRLPQEVSSTGFDAALPLLEMSTSIAVPGHFPFSSPTT